MTERPVPGPTPRPGPRPGATPPVAPAPAADAGRWGRVADDGTVYVRTSSGEREVGQWPGGDPAEALALYARRFAGLAVEVDLLERRVRAGTVPPDEAAGAVKALRTQVREAQAVGDLDGLLARLEALRPVLEEQREQRRADKAARLEEARADKERLVSEAETLATGTDWRGGSDRVQGLMERWKALPRLDKDVDDALWRRFSSARSAYSKRRRTHYAEQAERREGAREVKRRLVVEAEELAPSKEWGPTSGHFRDLMRQWKAAGPAPRSDEEALWARFRAAQDTFFGARDAVQKQLDTEYAANAEVKRALLVEAEALLPVSDPGAARSALRGISERWERAGKVPRGEMREIEGRLQAVEDAVKSAEQDRWRRSNPEARARAQATVDQLERSLADLRARQEQAVAAGDDRAATDAAEAISAREAWLVEAQRALTDFSP